MSKALFFVSDGASSYAIELTFNWRTVLDDHQSSLDLIGERLNCESWRGIREQMCWMVVQASKPVLNFCKHSVCGGAAMENLVRVQNRRRNIFLPWQYGAQWKKSMALFSQMLNEDVRGKYQPALKILKQCQSVEWFREEYKDEIFKHLKNRVKSIEELSPD